MQEPLNSEDDVTDDDQIDLFDTENVVVCQYDKVQKKLNSLKYCYFCNSHYKLLADYKKPKQMEILLKGWYYELKW